MSSTIRGGGATVVRDIRTHGPASCKTARRVLKTVLGGRAAVVKSRSAGPYVYRVKTGWRCALGGAGIDCHNVKTSRGSFGAIA